MTTIEWTDKSTNPIRAYHRQTGAVGHYCEKLSSGCAHCYASNLQRRFVMPEFPGKSRLEKLALMDDRGRVIVNEHIELGLEQHALDTVLNRKKPTMWFWCDMTDMFGPWVPDVWLDKCFAVMNATQVQLPIPRAIIDESGKLLIKSWHTHQILTKRIERAYRYVESRLAKHFPKVGSHPLFEAGRGEGGSLRGRGEKGVDLMNAGAVLSWPLSNVWLGTSCENQATFNDRVPWLVKTPAAVQFLSVEPLLGPIDLGLKRNLTIGWVIVGGESGSKARGCQVEWIRDIVKQCKSAGVPVFVKQLGKHASDVAKYGNNKPTGLLQPLYLKHPKGGDMAEWPEDLRVRQFPNVSNYAQAPML